MTKLGLTALPQLHPFPEVAEQLGISLRTLRERSWAKEFAHVRIGRERYLTDEQLADLIKTFTVPADRASKREADLEKTQERQSRRKARVPQQRRAAA